MHSNLSGSRCVDYASLVHMLKPGGVCKTFLTMQISCIYHTSEMKIECAQPRLRYLGQIYRD